MQNEEKQTVTMTVELLRSAKSDLEAFNQKIPFLVSFTPEQRQENCGTVPGVRTLGLLRRRVTVAEQKQPLLPAQFDLGKLKHDTDLAEALFGLLTTANQIRDRISDTLAVVGHPAVANAGVAVAHIRLAEQSASRLSAVNRRKRRSHAVPVSPPADPASMTTAESAAETPTQKAA